MGSRWDASVIGLRATCARAGGERGCHCRPVGSREARGGPGVSGGAAARLEVPLAREVPHAQLACARGGAERLLCSAMATIGGEQGDRGIRGVRGVRISRVRAEEGAAGEEGARARVEGDALQAAVHVDLRHVSAPRAEGNAGG